MIKTKVNLALAIFLTGCAGQRVTGKNSYQNAKSRRYLAGHQNSVHQNYMDNLVSNLEKEKNSPQKYEELQLFTKIDQLIMEERFNEALVYFQNFDQKTLNQPSIFKKHVLVLVRAGELSKATTLIEDLYVSVSKKKIAWEEYHKEIFLVLAGLYSATGNFVEAGELYKEFIAKTDASSDEDACVFYSKILNQQEKEQEALSVLKSCHQKYKQSGVFAYYLGKTYELKGNASQAKKYYQLSSKRQPDFSPAVKQLASLYNNEGNWKKSIQIYDQFLTANPDNIEITESIMELLFEHEQVDKILAFAEKLTDLEPDNLNHKVRLGVLYVELDKLVEADSLFLELLAIVPENENILYYLGAINQQLKRYELAVNYYSQINEESPLFLDSHLQMAKILSDVSENEMNRSISSLGAQEFSLKDLQQKWQEIPETTQLVTVINKIQKSYWPQKNEVEVRVVLKELLTLEASYFESIAMYEKASQSIEKIQEMELGEMSENYLFYLAYLKEQAGDKQSAEKIVWQMIEKDEQNAHAWNYLGYSLLKEAKDLDKARKYILKALSLAPQDPYIRDSYGWLLFKEGQFAEAIKELEIAHNQTPNDPAIIKHLAKAYIHKGYFARAKEILQAPTLMAASPKDFFEINEINQNLLSVERERLPASGK